MDKHYTGYIKSGVAREKHEGVIEGFINGPVLKYSEMMVESFNVPWGKHRWMCGVGLTTGMLVGDTIMRALTHKTVLGKPIFEMEGGKYVKTAQGKNKLDRLNVRRDFVYQLLDWLGVADLTYGPAYHREKPLIDYSWHGQTNKDLWTRTAHQIIPGLFGAVGLVMASRAFFHHSEQKKFVEEFLDEYDHKVAYRQSESWRKYSALTSLPSAVSGFHLLPFPLNNSMAIGNSFTLAADRKVITPGFSWWSNNPTRFPQQPAALLRRMAEYGGGNPGHELKDLREMIRGVLLPLFDNKVTQQQIEGFAQDFLKLRDELILSGKSPRDVRRALRAHITGEGLEMLLEKLGFQLATTNEHGQAVPLVHLGNNGFTSAIVQPLVKKETDEMGMQWAKKYLTRKHKREEQHLDHPHENGYGPVRGKHHFKYGLPNIEKLQGTHNAHEKSGILDDRYADLSELEEGRRAYQPNENGHSSDSAHVPKSLKPEAVAPQARKGFSEKAREIEPTEPARSR